MALKMPFSSLIRMEDFYTVLTLHDNSRWVQDGFSEGQKVAVWSKRGKTLISKESFTEFVNTVKFDLIECPYDDHYSKIESKKRLKKALDRTQGFIDTIFATEGITVENVLSVCVFHLKHLLHLSLISYSYLPGINNAAYWERGRINP